MIAMKGRHSGNFGLHNIMYDCDFVWMSDPLRTLEGSVGPCQDISWLKPPRHLDPTQM